MTRSTICRKINGPQRNAYISHSFCLNFMKLDYSHFEPSRIMPGKFQVNQAIFVRFPSLFLKQPIFLKIAFFSESEIVGLFRLKDKTGIHSN